MISFRQTQVDVMKKSLKNGFERTIAISTALFVDVIAANAEETKPKKTKKPKVLETELGIKYIDLKKGSGPFPQTGDYVVIEYRWSPSDPIFNSIINLHTAAFSKTARYLIRLKVKGESP